MSRAWWGPGVVRGSGGPGVGGQIWDGGGPEGGGGLGVGG